MINKLIIDTLQPLGIPVCFQKYNGNEDTYITFFCYNEQGELFADDVEIQTMFYVQIDIWSKGNYNDIAKQTRELLENVGFKRTSSIDLYEKDTGVYHKSMRFFYAQNN
ncbi:hypothetical protein [Tepidibacter thalassicus]|uniref:Uncharacterized protein n=1 Tax=Tepidibacter thalassicus DSM 15285 TaxID=1123350 RepID=A0A1M5PW69_9FIRM|nr:hypothetical protein [Tepidibacter thalassicus]SHH05900.1 hypothetical protein SAMN02744040_00632 [Tepidibacter thalassicus DSM 15285]